MCGGVGTSGRKREVRAMKAIDRLLSKLEDRLGLTKNLFLVVLSDAVKRGLDDDTCVDILRDGGFLPTGGVATVDLTQVPGGLNAEETKRFVRENGPQICGSRVDGPGTGRHDSIQSQPHSARCSNSKGLEDIDLAAESFEIIIAKER
jgi:hypothetical protein